MDTLLKSIQVVFYITASIITVLTFIKAKNGLLNSVNTEYQKRVMDRLAKLSDELFSEFDPSSESHWLKQHSVKEVLERLHEEIIPYKAKFLENPDAFPGIPSPKEWDDLSNFLNKIKSDPFIPSTIRNILVQALEKRVNSMLEIYLDETRKYIALLHSGKHWETLDTNHHWLHNKINKRLYDNGIGISQLEDAAHSFRLNIQAYLESFNPIK